MALRCKEMQLFWYTNKTKISLPWEGDVQPPPPVSHFAPSLFPPLTNPGYTTVTGVAKGGTRAHAPLGRFTPSLWPPVKKKILAMPVIILFMFALYISRCHSVRNTHFPWICNFFLLFTDNFPKKIHPKCAPDRSISISKMQKLLRLGGGTPPSQTLPPLGRFAPSLAFSLQYCKSCPPTKKFLRTALDGNTFGITQWIPRCKKSIDVRLLSM